MKSKPLFLAMLLQLLILPDPVRADLADGLIAYYPFSGDATDATGHGHSGLIHGSVSPTQDRYDSPDSAYHFDGTDGYISGPDTTSQPISTYPPADTPRTFFAWIRTSSNTPQVIFFYGTPSDCAGYYVLIDNASIHCSPSFEAYAILAGTWGSGGNVCGTSTVTDGQWHSVATTFDGVLHEIYVDGVLSTSRQLATNTTLQSEFYFGKVPASGAHGPKYFTGDIDDIRIYNRALSPVEICSLSSMSVTAEICNNSLDDDCDGLVDAADPDCPCCDLNSGLVAYYPFEGNADDLSVAANHGAVHGDVSYTKGIQGLAATLDGIDDYVIASADHLPTRERTISLWFYTESLGSPQPVLLGYGGSGCGTSWFMNLSPNPLEYFGASGHCSANSIVTGYFYPPVNAWYHWAITTGPRGTTLYVNGFKLTANDTFVSNTYVLEKDFSIGVGIGVDGKAPYTDANIGYFSGKIDEVRIYDRVLSEREITALYNRSIGLRITTGARLSAEQGKPFCIKLGAMGGEPPLSWSVTSGSTPDGIALTADGLLSGSSGNEGEWTFGVRVEDSVGTSVDAEFTLAVLGVVPAPEVLVHKGGTTAVPGRVIDYFILVENVGTTPAVDAVLIEVFTFPSHFEYVGGAPSPERENDSGIVWGLGVLDPGESKLVHYGVRLSADVAQGRLVYGPAWGGERGDSVTAIGNWADFCNNEFRGEIPKCVDRDLLSGCCWICELAAVGGEQLSTDLKACLDCLDYATKACDDYGELVPGTFRKHQQPAKESTDPNDMIVLPPGFVRPSQQLNYTIWYDNKGDADAETITVKTTLDSHLDMRTLRIVGPDGAEVAIADGSTVVLLEEDRTRVEIVDVGGQPVEVVIPYVERRTVTRTGRQLSWLLEGVFLEPLAAESVMFSVYPLPDLESGTEILGEAVIKFDTNDEMATTSDGRLPVKNIIDASPPIGTMDILPEITTTIDIPISWSGTDAVGRIEYYTIYVSNDGGATFSQVPGLERATGTNATYHGENGTTYLFCCRATDEAGNREAGEITGEVYTRIELPGGLQRPGDGNGDGRLDISDAVATLGFLFLGSPKGLPCGDGGARDPGNLRLLDWQPDGAIDISDAVATLSFLFVGGPPHAMASETEPSGCVRIQGCSENCR